MASDVTCAGTALDKDSAVTLPVVPNRRFTLERREGSRHWIARLGCVSPGGYRRSSIGLVGGSQLGISDPRRSRQLCGRGYMKPVVRSADSDEPKPMGPRRISAGAPFVMWRCE